jgi:methylenetetrahydrofolate reductase (NADPH)
MKIIDKFGQGRTLFTIEVFPPKKYGDISSLYRCIDEIKTINPDYISVTYGAAGNPSDRGRSIEVAEYIEKQGLTASMHLTCIASSKADVLTVAGELKARGIENILALRGDYPNGTPPKQDFAHASDLAVFLRENGDFDLSGACYPETHNEALNVAEDIRNLKIKVDAGVSHLVSQLFFDNNIFYDFCEKLEIAGINVPVEAGIMPVTNVSQINRMVSMCGASIPVKLSRIMNRYADNPEALKDAGISYAIDQITDLIAAGVPGIHLYAMNNAAVVKRIYESIKSLL